MKKGKQIFESLLDGADYDKTPMAWYDNFKNNWNKIKSKIINIFNMNSISKIFKISFFVFLDISGILLGVFLIGLGLFLLFGWQIANWMNWLLLIIGICAFLLHLGHYFNLKYMRWFFGPSAYFYKDSTLFNARKK
ncbi:MAG: hypothetical protein Q8Q92_01465 [bacterium]|nr:hypothetical protein [bacterium]